MSLEPSTSRTFLISKPVNWKNSGLGMHAYIVQYVHYQNQYIITRV